MLRRSAYSQPPQECRMQQTLWRATEASPARRGAAPELAGEVGRPMSRRPHAVRDEQARTPSGCWLLAALGAAIPFLGGAIALITAADIHCALLARRPRCTPCRLCRCSDGRHGMQVQNGYCRSGYVPRYCTHRGTVVCKGCAIGSGKFSTSCVRGVGWPIWIVGYPVGRARAKTAD